MTNGEGRCHPKNTGKILLYKWGSYWSNAAYLSRISYSLETGIIHKFFMPMLMGTKKTFGVKRLIVITNKTLNSGDKITNNTILGD
jgi:hypothetical protein